VHAQGGAAQVGIPLGFEGGAVDVEGPGGGRHVAGGEFPLEEPVAVLPHFLQPLPDEKIFALKLGVHAVRVPVRSRMEYRRVAARTTVSFCSSSTLPSASTVPLTMS